VYQFAPNFVPQILLYHAPDLMPEATEKGIDLYLCGHTHGGQVRLPWIGAIWTSSQYGKQYEMGHYHQSRTNLYVSRGIGLEGLSAPRIRFLAPPEITLITLQGKQ
jgi:predicted MPP superfamily phosphohydrolase